LKELMPLYNIEYSYTIREWDGIVLDCEDETVAAVEGLQFIKDNFPDVTDIEIEDITLVKESV
jgi:hypothetical protein